MSWKPVSSLLLALALVACVSTQRSRAPIAQEAAALEVHRAWWSAAAASDGANLRATSSNTLTATFSSGKRYDLPALLEAAQSGGRAPETHCKNESVQRLDASISLVTSDCTETVGQYSTTYHFLSVLRSTADGLRVSAAQSTIVAAHTKRLEGLTNLNDYAGGYVTPRGLTLEISSGGTNLQLREPSGKELRLEPIGPDLFEASYIAPGGWITRYSFARDGNGRVASMNVLSPGAVNTFPRRN